MLLARLLRSFLDGPTRWTTKARPGSTSPDTLTISRQIKMATEKLVSPLQKGIPDDDDAERA